MNKKILTRTVTWVFAAAFLAFLYIAMAATLLRDEETFSYYENRNLAVMPEYTEEGVYDGSYFARLEKYLNDHSAGRNTILKTITYIDINILRRLVVNDVVICRDKNVYLPFNEYESIDKETIRTDAEIIANRLLSHSELTESYGGEFYYVAVPCQYVCREDNYPWYMNNRAEYTRASSEALFGKLESCGVNYIDMLEVYKSKGSPEYFSSAIDNHYGIIGAYDTYCELMSRILSGTEFKPNIMYEGDFTVAEVENRYLGSRTRKLFGEVKSGEKLSIIIPGKAVPFQRWNYGNLGYPIVYHLPVNQGEDVLYTMYMGGDIANTVIRTEREELPSILIYGDSFTNALECIAYYSFDTMYSLDYRHYTDMTLEEFIDMYKPNIVVCVRDYETLLTKEYNGQ